MIPQKWEAGAGNAIQRLVLLKGSDQLPLCGTRQGKEDLPMCGGKPCLHGVTLSQCNFYVSKVIKSTKCLFMIQ